MAEGRKKSAPKATRSAPKQRPNVDTVFIKSQLDRVDMSQRELAKALSMSPIAITHILQGKRRFRFEHAVEMARLFSLPLETMLSATGFPLDGAKRQEAVPIVGWIDGNSTVHLGAARGDRTAPPPAWGVSKQLRALRYQTNGTALEGMNSGLVYFMENEGPPGVIGIDDISRLAVVEIGDTKQPLQVVGVVKKAASGSFRRFDVYLSTGAPAVVEATVRYVHPIVWIKL